MNFARALALFAHPDDAEFMFGGTIASWIAEGTEVHYVVATDGSAGSNEPGMTRESIRPIRRAEQEAAAASLGVASVTHLDFLDGELMCDLGLRRAVTRQVRRLRPDVLLAPDPSQLWLGRTYINHPDHKAAGEAALCAVMPDAPSRPQFPELLDEGLEPFDVPALWLSSAKGDTFVDISSTIEAKIAAIACHASQADDLPEVADMVREWAIAIGERGGLELAESFRTFDFT